MGRAVKKRWMAADVCRALGRGFTQEKDGVAYLNLETVARGLGFTDNKNGVEYVKWERVKGYLEELKFSPLVGKDDYIPENIFYRLAMKAKNETAEKFQTLIADEVILGVGLSAQNFK